MVSWKTSTPEKHQALEKKSYAKVDPVWQEIMDEVERGSPVELLYDSDKERGTLARSIGRRAAHRGFKVDIRNGQEDDEQYISVARVAE